MSNSQSSRSGGVGFFGLLTLLFITLKLCGVITWPWIWVLAGFWIPLSIVLVCAIVMGIIYVIIK